MSEENAKKTFDTARQILSVIYFIFGGLVFCSLFFLIYNFGLINLFYTLFFIWVGTYMLFAKNFVYSIKARTHWSKVKRDLAVAIIRAPMTVVNLLFIALYLFGGRVPMLMWIFLLAAWSIFPCFKLIDYLEDRKCS